MSIKAIVLAYPHPSTPLYFDAYTFEMPFFIWLLEPTSLPTAFVDRSVIAEILIRLVCLSALISQDSNDRKTAGFAFPTTSCTPNWIYSRFDLILELNPIAAIVGRGFIPSTLDAAKCEVVPVAGCVELQSDCPYCTLQDPTVGDSRAGPGITCGRSHKDVGVWLPRPFRADAHSPRADVLRRGRFREHGLSSTGEQHFELPGTPLFSPALSSCHGLAVLEGAVPRIRAGRSELPGFRG